MNQDEEQLRLLSIFHYVVGGLAALFSFFPIVHLVIGLMFILAPEEMSSGEGEDLPPAFFGWFFVSFAGAFIVAGLIFSALILITGRFLARRKHRTFCLVMAGVECLFMPLGTVLGAFTIVVLTRESVRPHFAGETGSPPAPADETGR